MRNKKMSKKLLTIACLVMITMVFSGCTSSEEDKNQETTTNSNKESNKAPNQEDNDNSNNPAGVTEWPSDMPDVVPEFTYGNIRGILGYSDPWIIGYGDVQYADLESYKVDLEAKGWDVSLDKGAYETASLAGEYGDEYVVMLSYSGESQGLQFTCGATEAHNK